MTEHKVVRLEDLPKIFNQTTTNPIPKSTDPLVDGTAMTTNPEIKLRRKRIMSQQDYKTKRPRIAEFINACKFLAGETSKVFPLSTQHLNILSLVRNSKAVPETYLSVINSNWDTVQKAAALKPREIRERYKNPQESDNKQEYLKRTFSAWLHRVLNYDLTALNIQNYTDYVKSYYRGNILKIPKIVIDILDVLTDESHKKLSKNIYLDPTKEKEEQIVTKENSKRQVRKFEIAGIKITTKARSDQTVKCAKEFITWINSKKEPLMPIIDSPVNYLTQIKAYLKVKNGEKCQILQPVIKQILDQDSWIVNNYTFIKQGKRHVLKLKETITKSDVIELDTKKSKESSHDDIPDALQYAATMPSLTKPLTTQEAELLKEEITNNSKTMNIQVPNFIQYLKDLGVKEFTIKF